MTDKVVDAWNSVEQLSFYVLMLKLVMFLWFYECYIYNIIYFQIYFTVILLFPLPLPLSLYVFN